MTQKPPSPAAFIEAITSPKRRQSAMAKADAAAIRANQDLILNTPGLPPHADAANEAADLARASGGKAREAGLAYAAAMECVCGDFLLAQGRRLAALEAFGFGAEG